MIRLGQAEQQVARRLPPAKGRFVGWDWQRFYNAILHVMQNPTSQNAHFATSAEIQKLPAVMRFTPQILTAGWARFCQLYHNLDFGAAYQYMKTFLEQSSRMDPDDGRQWWAVEEEWQALEVPAVGFISMRR